VVGEVLLGEEEKGETTAVEVIFSGVLSLILLASLITSLGYSPQVRLFPVIVSIAGLILNAYWFNKFNIPIVPLAEIIAIVVELSIFYVIMKRYNLKINIKLLRSSV